MRTTASKKRPHVVVFNGYFCSMALVPYVENPLPALSKLHSSSAQFRFVDRDVRLAQDWRRLGVAAVVWDAVSVGSLDASRPAGCHCLNLTGPCVCVCVRQAVVMCMYLELGKVDVKGKEVIELGAGTGLVGIVAALMGE